MDYDIIYLGLISYLKLHKEHNMKNTFQTLIIELYDIIYHFNLEMKEPEYTVTKNETDDTIEILTLTNNYQNENGHSECSCLLTGKLADGKSITIDLVIPDNGILNVHKSHYNFDSIEKIEIKRVHKFRSSDTTLQPIVKIISVEA